MRKIVAFKSGYVNVFNIVVAPHGRIIMASKVGLYRVSLRRYQSLGETIILHAAYQRNKVK